MKTELRMTITSDTCPDIFPDNYSSDFSVKIPHAIDLGHEVHEIGIQEICLPNSMVNVRPNHNKVEIFKKENDKTILKAKFRVPSDFYKNPSKAVKYLENKFVKFTRVVLDVLKVDPSRKIQGIHISYNNTKNEVTLDFPIQDLFSVRLGDDIINLLGFKVNHSKDFIYSHLTTTTKLVHSGIPPIFVCSNIINHENAMS